MDDIIEDLIAIIQREIDAFDELLDTLREKQRAIVEGEVGRLNSSVRNETRVTSETRQLEAERIERSKELARELNLVGRAGVSPKLSEIIEVVEEKYAERLSEQRELLRSLIHKVQYVNKSNQFLLDYSIKFVEQNIELLLGAAEKGKTVYAKDGKVAHASKKKYLDRCV
jgi:flagellar biosynthesis/type III secretory pathway chaperone